MIGMTLPQEWRKYGIPRSCAIAANCRCQGRVYWRRCAGEIIVAVPTGAAHTVKSLLPLVDTLFCLNVRGGWSFAVAEAYAEWYDLTEEEVLGIIQQL